MMNRSFIGGAQNNANQLLLKDDVGHSKPTTRALPPDGFTYGRPEIRDKEGASDGKLIIDVNVCQYQPAGSTTTSVASEALIKTSKDSIKQPLDKELQQLM